MSARDDLAQLLVKRAGDHIQMLDVYQWIEQP